MRTQLHAFGEVARMLDERNVRVWPRGAWHALSGDRWRATLAMAGVLEHCYALSCAGAAAMCFVVRSSCKCVCSPPWQDHSLSGGCGRPCLYSRPQAGMLLHNVGCVTCKGTPDCQQQHLLCWRHNLHISSMEHALVLQLQQLCKKQAVATMCVFGPPPGLRTAHLQSLWMTSIALAPARTRRAWRAAARAQSPDLGSTAGGLEKCMHWH